MADGAIMIKSVNVQKVTWANIVKRHFAIHNVWTADFVLRQLFAHAPKDIKADIVKEVNIKQTNIFLLFFLEFNFK